MKICWLPRGGAMPRAIGTALLALGLLAALPGVSRAQTVPDPDFWKSTADRQKTVNRFIYDQSPQPIPVNYSPVEEAEEILRAKQAGLSPSNTTAQALWQRIRTITVREALSTRMGAAGTLGLAALTSYVGVRIGSGIYAKYFEVKLPEATPWNPTWPQQLRFRTQGSSLYEGLNMPYDGWVWEWNPNSSGYWRGFWVTPAEHGTAEACPSNLNPTGIPGGFTEVIGAPHPNCNSYWNGGVAHAAVLREDDLGAHSPISDYTGQSYSFWFAEPTAPPQATVEQGSRPSSASRRTLSFASGSTTRSDHPVRRTPSAMRSTSPSLRSPLARPAKTSRMTLMSSG